MGEVFAKGIAKSNFYDGQIMDRHRYLSRAVMSCRAKEMLAETGLLIRKSQDVPGSCRMTIQP